MLEDNKAPITIAQALRRIKDLKGRVGIHCRNAQQSVTHKTKASPAYDFAQEWEKTQQIVAELLDLQERVAVANARTLVGGSVHGGRSLAWCVKKLAEIKGAIALFEGLAVKAADKTIEDEHAWLPGAGQTRVEVEYTCHLPERKRAEAVERMRSEFAELNDIVETMNHRTCI